LALLWLVPSVPAAAQEKVWRVGLLSGGVVASPGAPTTWQGELQRALALNGFDSGRNLVLTARYAENHLDRLPLLAREIEAAGADVVVAVSDPAVRAVLAATPHTPVVMVVGADPVESGLVAGLARPGGRITGIAYRVWEGDAKRLQYLSEGIPGARRFAALRLRPPAGQQAEMQARLTDFLAHAAAQLGVAFTMHLVAGAADYAAAFAAMKSEGAAGVIISSQPMAADAERVAASAAAHGLPTICEWDYMARVGCVFAYGHDLPYAQRRVGEYVVQILRGAVPAEMPVEQSDAWKLTVNLRAAARLGLAVPPALLARADEVIE
jgi:putative ABC transport system substrate-binding protein